MIDAIPSLWADALPTAAGLWLLLTVLALYLARRPAHDLIDLLGRRIAFAFRYLSRIVMRLEARLRRRDREMALAWAEAEEERVIEREHRRIQAIVDRSLSTYPDLHRTLADQVARIDQDYRQSADTPPTPPVWLDAIAAVARIEAPGDPAVAKILESINHTLEEACHNALLEYRATSRRRHTGLRRMLPYWRRLSSAMQDVRRTLERLERHAERIDLHVIRYETLRAGEDAALRIARHSSSLKFLISGALLAGAVLGGWLNLHLLAPPLEHIAGAPAGIAWWHAGEAAALLLIFWHVALGLAITEAAGLTRLFELPATRIEPLRDRVAWIALILLCLLSLVEASLTFLDARPLPPHLAPSADGAGLWLHAAAKALLALLLPLALALAALPLATFMRTGHRVAVALAQHVLLLLALILKVCAPLMLATSAVAIRLYDLAVFLPLWVEARVRHVRAPAETLEVEQSQPPRAP